MFFSHLQSAASTGTPDLPLEIIEHIIDLVQELPHDDDHVYDADLYPILKACALTCHGMTPRSQYWLFRRIILSKQSQADRLTEILRKNAQVARYTRSLTIQKLSHEGPGVQSTWISWIPQLLGPKMTNLKTLYLVGDVFSKCHPTLSMALVAFKCVRRLVLNEVQFSTFAACARLIRGFPRLEHLSLAVLSPQNRRTSCSSSPSRISGARSRQSSITHLDLWSASLDESGLHDAVQWLASINCHLTLRTLYLPIEDDGIVPNVLRCASNACSIFIMRFSDSHAYASGFEHCTRLQVLHLNSTTYTLPVHGLTSILLSIPSHQLQKLVVYVDGEDWEQHIEDQHDGFRYNDDDYLRLDDALSKLVLKTFTLVLCLCGTQSADAVTSWQGRLPTLLPKFCKRGRFSVECTRTKDPHLRWRVHRDGF